MLDGVVRDLSATIGINEVLTNVTKFDAACGSGSSPRSMSKGAIAGMLSQLQWRCTARVILCGFVGIFCSDGHCIRDMGAHLG